MLTAEEFWETMIKNRVIFFSGVPCFLLANVLKALSNYPEVKYAEATREDAALAVASGAGISGTHSGILIQNSGLGNIVNGLSSFNLIYKIPVLLIITWRGFSQDAPEHRIMGKCTRDILKLLGIPVYVLRTKQQLSLAVKRMNKLRIPVAVLVKEGVIL